VHLSSAPLSKSVVEPHQQVEFLTNIQRLLAEVQFTSNYKYALLLALADLCVDGAVLRQNTCTPPAVAGLRPSRLRAIIRQQMALP
jgi:hypothetical protein